MAKTNDYNLLSFEITDKQLNDWVPLDKNHKDPVDCAINVFRFFNIIDSAEIAANLSKLKNSVKQATMIPEMIYLLNQKMNNYKFIVKMADNYTDFVNIFNKIPINHGIIGLIGGNIIGHAIIVARTNNNNLIILDPQQNSRIIIGNYDSLKINNTFEKYIMDNKFITFQTFLYKLKKSPVKIKVRRSRKETNIQIRKKSTSLEQTRKKRKIKSNSVASKVSI